MIYIVEDDASIRELEQYALQTNQYTVRGFEDGASFWAACGRPPRPAPYQSSWSQPKPARLMW